MSYEQDIQAIKDGLEAGVITPEQAQQAIETMKKHQAESEVAKPLTEEGCEYELYYFRSLQIYAQDAKRKASFLVDDLDKIVSGTKEPHVYALRQLATDLKQYADDAL